MYVTDLSQIWQWVREETHERNDGTMVEFSELSEITQKNWELFSSAVDAAIESINKLEKQLREKI